jgi:hypothetical protein
MYAVAILGGFRRCLVAAGSLVRRPGCPLTALAFAAVAGACRSGNHQTTHESADVGTACTSISMVGISVDVRDASTQRPIAPGATLVIRDDKQVVDSVIGGEQARALDGAFERRGVFSIVVRRAGYREWRRDTVRVTGDICHVATVRLTAELSRR